MRRRRKKRIQLTRSGPWIGIGGLVIVLWFAIGSVLYAPWWGVLLNLVLLVPEAVLLKRWANSRPAWCVLVPLIGTAAYVLVAFVGAHYWGWSH
jgi:hypothetical protein